MKIKVPKVTAEKISKEEAVEMMTGFENLDEIGMKLGKWRNANERCGFLILGYNEDRISYLGTGGNKGFLAGIIASLITNDKNFREVMLPAIAAAEEWLRDNKKKVTIINGKEDSHAN